VALVYAHPRQARAVRACAREPALTAVPRRRAAGHRDSRWRVYDGDLVAELPLPQELAQLARRHRQPRAAGAGAAAAVEAGLVDAGPVHDQEPGRVGVALGHRDAQRGGAVVVLRVHVQAEPEELPERSDVVAARREAQDVAAGARAGNAREVVQDVEDPVVPRRDGVPQRRVALRVLDVHVARVLEQHQHAVLVPLRRRDVLRVAGVAKNRVPKVSVQYDVLSACNCSDEFVTLYVFTLPMLFCPWRRRRRRPSRP
jgi:hypothetical protein